MNETLASRLADRPVLSARNRDYRFLAVLFAIHFAIAEFLFVFAVADQQQSNAWIIREGLMVLYMGISNFLIRNWQLIIVSLCGALGILLPMVLTALLTSLGGYELRTSSTVRRMPVAKADICV